MAGTKPKTRPEERALQAVVAEGSRGGKVRADARTGARVQRRERIDVSRAGQLFVNVPLEDLQWFRHRAVDTRRSVSDLVREALREYKAAHPEVYAERA
jgi:hypothetical protein